MQKRFLFPFLSFAMALSGCDSTAPGPAAPATTRLLTAEQAACAIMSGTTQCWGANTNFFEFAASPAERPGSATPVPIAVPPLASLASGVGTHLCGITDDGIGVCWGRGGFGQLGGGTEGDAGNVATFVNTPEHWRHLDVGRLTTCGVTTEGTGYCWGYNQRGEVGDDAVALGTRVVQPHEIMGGHRWKTVVAGWLHACGITESNVTMCWGSNNSGQLGIGSLDTLAHRVPQAVLGGKVFVQLSAAARHTCGVTNTGEAYCWGLNNFGELGDGSALPRSTPSRVGGQRRYRMIATASGFAGGSDVLVPSAPQGSVGHTCALTDTGAAYCWGWNGNGQLGNGSRMDSFSPVPVAGAHTFDSIALGGTYTCARKDDAVWCWGSNALGQLGNGTFDMALVPTPVLSPFSGAPPP